METALYYPYVHVPQTPWFTQVLLYWDRAASIVPYSLRDQPDALDPYMHELAQEGLLHYVQPDSELWQRWEIFDQGFLELLNQRQAPRGELTFTRLHSDKLSSVLFDELKSRGLAKGGKGPEWESWWEVEVATADAYMAYLACAISGARSDMLPVTDQEQAIGTLAADSGDLKHRLAWLRYAVITRALPAPSGPVPAAQLKAFKEDNSERLRRCRTFLDSKLADLATVTDPELRKFKAAAVMQELEDDVALIQEGMNKRKWPRVVLVGFGGVMGAALATAATVATGGSALIVGLGVGAGVLQLGAAGQAAVELMKRPRYDSRAPLAYAALAGRLRP